LKSTPSGCVAIAEALTIMPEMLFPRLDLLAPATLALLPLIFVSSYAKTINPVHAARAEGGFQ
jgi:hypothetical protein